MNIVKIFGSIKCPEMIKTNLFIPYQSNFSDERRFNTEEDGIVALEDIVQYLSMLFMYEWA